MKVLAERFRAEELVRDQYSGRYPFELIQNASDAVAETGGAHAKVCFVLTDTALIVADQGDGFGADQVEAISGFASSSKDPRKTIGYKGLGFKSVNDITMTPQIFSPEVQFGFDDVKARTLVHEIVGGDANALQIPHYRFPFDITLADAGPDHGVVVELKEEYTTIIRLPFKDGVLRPLVEEELVNTLDPRLLLFLESLEKLELRGTSGDFSATIDREDGRECTEVLLESAGEVEHFLLYSAVKQIPDHSLVAALGGAWEQVDRVRVFAAVPLSADGLPDYESSEALHVYFPTEVDIGLPIVLCADFQMEFDRRRIANNPKALPYNKWLMGELGEFLVHEVVTSLVTRFEGHPRVAQSVVYPETSDNWSNLLRAKVIEDLSAVEFVRCVDGTIRIPSEAEFLPDSVPDPAYLQPLLPGLEYLVHAALENDPAAREFLTGDLDAVQLNADVMEHLQILDSAEAEPFYRFLVTWWEAAHWTLEQALTDAPCVRILDRSWVKPAEALMPPQRSDLVFPAGLTVPVADLPDVDELQDLLENAGLRTFDWRHVITDHLMPVLRSPDAPMEEWTGAMEALRYYFDSGHSDARVRADVADTLLRVRDSEGEVESRIPASHIYFGDDWLPTSPAFGLYGDYGEAEFLAEATPDGTEALAADIEFFAWLGVADRPRIFGLHGTVGSSAPNHGDIEDWSAYFAWTRSEKYLAASKCAQGHSARSHDIYEVPRIDRLDGIVQSGDPRKLTLLWSVIAEHWRYYAPAMTARFRCKHSQHRGERDRNFPSLPAWIMHNQQWVLGLQQNQLVYDRPVNVWLMSEDAPVSLQSSVVVLSGDLKKAPKEMLRFLGIVDSENPSAENLITLLRNLAADGHLDSDVEDNARWAMRRLNDVVSSIDDGALDAIPLLARKSGQPVFEVKPYVSRDRLAMRTWQDRFAIYDGDLRTDKLIEALDLPNLDTLVHAEPIAGEEDPVAQQTAAEALDAAKPSLLAVAISIAKSERYTLAGALNELQTACVAELAVAYLFDGERRIASGLTTLVVTRKTEDVTKSGIAYFAPDSVGGFDWLSLGPQVAEYLNCAELGDSFALILSSDRDSRIRYLDSRGLTKDDIEAASEILRLTPAPVTPKTNVDIDGPPPPEREQSTDDARESRDEESVSDVTDAHKRRDAETTLTVPDRAPVDRRTNADHALSDDPGARQREPEILPEALAGSSATHTAEPGQSSARQRKSRFFTYVLPESAPQSSASTKQLSDRSVIDQRGIDHVVNFELSADRWPDVQPHSNPGFDIESRFEDGTLARIIEVKSISGSWGKQGVTVSKRQLEENQTREDAFWLYVVEYANDPARARVIPIHNPYKHAESFVFDDGWLELSNRN